MTGNLKVKNGMYYAVINYKDKYGRYKQKFINSKLKERGNKKEAQKFLAEQIEKFSINDDVDNLIKEEPLEQNDIIFIDYMKNYITEKNRSYRHQFIKVITLAGKLCANFLETNLN